MSPRSRQRYNCRSFTRQGGSLRSRDTFTIERVIVAESLFRKATGDGREGVIAAIFWMNTRAGWREAIDHRIEGAPTFVARLPEPVTSMYEWIDRYTPRAVGNKRK